MKVLIIIAVLVATAASKPADQMVELTQDTAGNYKLALNLEGHSRVENRNSDGTLSGSFSYVDPNGVLQTVEYTSGPDGFHASGSNLPVAPIDHNVPVKETPEVAQARALHLAALEKESVPELPEQNMMDV